LKTVFMVDKIKRCKEHWVCVWHFVSCIFTIIPFLLCIWKVPSSILSPETGCHEFFMVFLSFSKQMML
jgi:hypothetical protein